MQYITDTAMMPKPVVEFIDGLLPLLPGEPEQYVTASGRPDIDKIYEGVTPHSHSTQAASDLIISMWTGTNPLFKIFSNADSHGRAHLAVALNEFAEGIFLGVQGVRS